MSHLIEIRDLKKIYSAGEEPVAALDGVSLAIDNGEFVAIMGASGSGKSTMLNILGCLDVPTSGSYLLDGKYADLRKGLKEYKKYPDFAAAFLDIDSKRLDAVVVDEILVRYYMKKAPGKYKVLKEDLGKEVVGVGFRKDDKEFAARIDKILDEMKKDGTCKKISMQWFGTDITRYEDKK